MLADGAIEGGSPARGHRAWTPLASALAAVGDNWTLMIILQLRCGRTRLRSLQRRLPGVSAGVLERYVGQMEGLGLLRRFRYSELPPRVELELTSAGRELLPVAGALARWGMRTVWEQPRGNARVDIGGLLGLLPVLLENASSVRDGALTLVLEAADGVSEWSFEVRDGHLRTLPTPPARRREDAVLEPAHRRASPARAGEDARPKSKAVVRGDEAAWIAALGPQRDYSGLAFTGARRFARAILEALPGRP